VGSIAFLPGIIAMLFLFLSIIMIGFDSSEAGKNLKSNLHWLSLKDASTARSICSAIASGIISLSVFSFSMVMILLNQAASQMSNRVLGELIGNRFQQFVLGFYIGTIVYALFLLSTIRDINTGIYVPALSTYLLIALTILDIFLFIYFLHYITQSIRYETIIHKIYNKAKSTEDPASFPIPVAEKTIYAYKSGRYQGFDKNNLLAFCSNNNVQVHFIYPVGSYLLEGSPLLILTHTKDLPNGFDDNLNTFIQIDGAQEISINYVYGLKQLTEIAIKALSPGINDPGTAVISLHALSDLLAYKLKHFPQKHFKDKEGIVRVIAKENTFEEVFEEFIMPIWDYGKDDRLVQQQMLHILKQLKSKGDQPVIDALLMLVITSKRNISAKT
jgi:uncharacterized membrane protein